jgi:metallophosphoesterase (TIGR00282 family)
MKILVIGDVTSPAGIKHLTENLWKIREQNKIDFCIVNGENASFISGISKEGAELLLRHGADCITGGNHSLRNKNVFSFFDDTNEILRPINFGDLAPGRGYTVIDTGAFKVLVINALGTAFIEPSLDLPYAYIDKVLSECMGKYDFSILDFHAEASGEKLTLAYAYDGKINVVFGTHTHVQTADEQILPNGTGYITDVGMCGESEGVLGMDVSTMIYRLKTRLPEKYKPAMGKCVANGVIFEICDKTKKTLQITRIKF